MKKRSVLMAAAVMVVTVGIFLAWGYWRHGAQVNAQTAQSEASPRSRDVIVTVATTERKKTPVRVEALGTVMPIASVAIKTRIDSEITAIHFADGAVVKQGDILVTLDSRAIEAQIKQAEGNLARDKAQREGAQRDVNRYTELVAKNATPVTNLDNAKTQVAIYEGAIMADEAVLQNLKVQLDYCSIRAPISGRISAAAFKVGNIVRAADLTPIATINQTAPLYVSFPMPQNQLAALRQALAAKTASIRAVTPGDNRVAEGAVTMIENSVDATTGTVQVRATMPNADELLWPGTLVQVQLTLREEEGVVVPTAAMQMSQSGSYVYVVKDGKALQQPVKVARTLGPETVLESGLSGGEKVVTNGHLQLRNGAAVAIREGNAGT
ncbi:MAG: efflux RND transporter periplasmic adaptor subunit [Pseudorhodoplanes sp.]